MGRSRSINTIDIARLLRRAAEHDAHSRRLWQQAIAEGLSPQWVERRLAEVFRTPADILRTGSRSFLNPPRKPPGVR